MIWGGSGVFWSARGSSMGCGSGTVIWGIDWDECDKCAVWWLSVLDPESSSGSCSSSSSLEDSYDALYDPLGLQDIGCGGSVGTGGSGGGKSGSSGSSCSTTLVLVHCFWVHSLLLEFCSVCRGLSMLGDTTHC